MDDVVALVLPAISCTAQSRECPVFEPRTVLLPVAVEAQPPAVNVQGLVKGLDELGTPLNLYTRQSEPGH